MNARSGQRGQVLVFISLVLTLVLLPLAAYSIDSVTIAAASARLQAATAEAAMLAAQQIDESAFRSRGEMTIDEGAARDAATGLLSIQMPHVTIEAMSVEGSRLTLRTSESLALPIDFFPTRSIVLRANASARLTEGYERPSSRLPLPISTF